MKVVVVFKFGFISEENQIGNAIIKRVDHLFVDDVENLAEWKASAYISKQRESSKQYKGWDGVTYPWWMTDTYEAS